MLFGVALALWIGSQEPAELAIRLGMQPKGLKRWYSEAMCRQAMPLAFIHLRSRVRALA